MPTHDDLGEAGGIRNPSAAEVIANLARQGYGRRFEVRHGHLWCPSCDVVFDGHDLQVDTAVAVGDGTGVGTVYALRCAACGAAGTWLVSKSGAEEMRLIGELRAAVAPRATGRDTPRT